MDRLEGWEIDALESLVRQYEWSAHDYYSKAYDIEMDSDDAKILEKAIKIIKAIPSAELREVLYSGDGYADGEMVYDMAECPNCGREFEDGDETWGCNFCPDCGQALKWEGE